MNFTPFGLKVLIGLHTFIIKKEKKMIRKESDGKHFDPHTGNPEPILSRKWLGLSLL